MATRVLFALARKARGPRDPTACAEGFPVFDVKPDTPPLTPEMVRDALEGR